jgi:uncharacterized protein YbjT (DUF2867 family)
MRILVTGATGLIGSAVTARAIAEGHAVVTVIRPGSRTRPAGVASVIEIDIARGTNKGHWEAHLEGIDAVVNCAGVLQSGPRQSPGCVHHLRIAALFEACRDRQVRRIIHFSAIGVERGALSEFSESKLSGDEALMALDLDWVILRPSVVLGHPASGASALVRGLAALPVQPVMPHTGPLQVVQLGDVVRTVLFFLAPSAPGKVVLELAGPERLAFDDIVAEYRRWLGWRIARRVALPAFLSALLYRLGDVAGWLGWHPAVRSNSRREIVRGAVGDATEWRELTGLQPRTLAETLAARPASVQERWFARFLLLKPVVYAVLAFFWIGTGAISLGPGFDIGLNLLQGAGLSVLAGPAVVAGAFADIVVGAGILYRPTARVALYCAIGLSLFYMSAGTVLVPGLWEDPLGPMMKIWPILVLNIIGLAILDER